MTNVLMVLFTIAAVICFATFPGLVIWAIWFGTSAVFFKVLWSNLVLFFVLLFIVSFLD